LSYKEGMGVDQCTILSNTWCQVKM